MPRRWSAELYVSTTPTSPTSPAFPSISKNEAADELSHNLQAERQDFQKKLYTTWFNSKLALSSVPVIIDDLYEDLKDGKKLLVLLEVLTGRRLKPVKGNLRLHHLNNITLAFDVLKECRVKIIGIHNDSIADGDVTSTLGLSWSIMYHFQVIEALEGVSSKNVVEFLLEWCGKIVANYSCAEVKSFKPKAWKKGYTINALIHAFKPELFLYSDLSKMNSTERWEHAIAHAQKAFSAEPLFSAEEFHSGAVDSKILVLYISSLYEQMKKLPQPVANNNLDADESHSLNKQLNGLTEQLNVIQERSLPVAPDVVTDQHVEEIDVLFRATQNSLQEICDQLKGVGEDIKCSKQIQGEEKEKMYAKLQDLFQLADKILTKWKDSLNGFKIMRGDQREEESKSFTQWMDQAIMETNTLKAFEMAYKKIQEDHSITEGTVAVTDLEKLLFDVSNHYLKNLSQLFSDGEKLVKTYSDEKQKDSVQRKSKNIDDLSKAMQLNIETRLKSSKSKLMKNKTSEEFESWISKIDSLRKSFREIELTAQKHKQETNEKMMEKAIIKIQNLLMECCKLEGNVENLSDEAKRLSSVLSSERKINKISDECSNIQSISTLTKKLLENIMNRVVEKAEIQRANESKELNSWLDEAADIKRMLREYERKSQARTARNMEELKVLIDELHDLLNELNGFQPSLENLCEKGDSLIKKWSNEQKIDEIKQEVDYLHRFADNVKSTIEGNLERLKENYDAQNADEDDKLCKWKEKCERMNAWLVDMEEKCIQLQEMEVETTLVDIFADLLQKVKRKNASDKPSFDIDFGESLLENTHIENPAHRERMVDDVKNFVSRKSALDENIMKCEEKLEKALRKEEDKQTKEFNDWLKKVVELKKILKELEVAGQQKDVDSKEELLAANQAQQIIKEKFRDLHQEIQSIHTECEQLMETNKTKADDFRSQSKDFQHFCKSVDEYVDAVHRSYKNRLEDLEEENKRHNENILMRLNLFHDWIRFAKQQLEFVQKKTSKTLHFNDLILKEQGLKKLEMDMDLRSEEFGNFMKILDEFSNEESQTQTKKDEEVLAKINTLKTEWDHVIETTDQEFKKLYDEINSLVDKKRASIEKSLTLIEKQLNVIEKHEKNEKSMNEASKAILDLIGEISNIKSPLSKLTKKTVALNDVSVFLDDEKTALKDSVEDLQLRYVNCRDKANEIKKSLQDNINEHIQNTCKLSSEKLQLLRTTTSTVQAVDMNDLNSMTEYLKIEQENVEAVKTEHIRMDDLEQFAEGISTDGFVSPDHQIIAADTINKTLKEVEEIRKQQKENVARVYAVAYHTLEQNFQNLVNRLQRTDDEISEIKDTNIRDCDQAVDIMQSIKSNEEDLMKLREEKEEMSGDLKEMEKILQLSDIQQLHVQEERFNDQHTRSTQLLHNEKEKVGEKINKLVEKKLDFFNGWFPTMKKRSDEPFDVGPDLVAIGRQLQEVQIIEQQANAKSFYPFFTERGACAFSVITPDKQEDVTNAHEHWKHIKQWLDTRREELESVHDLWEEFNNCCMDLSGYLNKTECDIQTWNELDLNDNINVKKQKDILKDSLVAMETRKPHAMSLNELTGRLLAMIGDDGPTSDKVRSQVADVFEFWNNLCKKIIENTTKLNIAHEKFQAMESKSGEIRNWIQETVEVLQELSSDEKDIEESLKKVELKRNELKEYEEKMNEVLETSGQLSDNPETGGHFTVGEDVQLLHRDFQGVTNELERLQKFFSRAKLFLRRARQSIKKKLSSNAEKDEKLTDMEEVSSSVTDSPCDDIEPAAVFMANQQQQAIAVK